VVSQAVEDYTGRTFRRQSVVQNYDGGNDTIILDNTPVQSVTSVTEYGVTLTASQYAFRSNGVMTRLWGPYTAGQWGRGRDSVTVTYVTGYTEVPAPVRHAALLLLQHLWETQLGSAPLLRPSAEEEYMPNLRGTSFTMPRRVMELLDPYVLMSVG
jgi:hypothetical protein